MSIVIPIVYLIYTATVCLVSIRCTRWWMKLLITAMGIGGLSALPSIGMRLAALFSSLLSMVVSVGVYILLFVLFIRCMFPHHGRNLF